MTLEAKKILVTGADGFIGSHLVELLASKGCEITALAQYNSFNNHGWIEQLNCKDSINVVSGDIRDPFFCKNLVSGVDVVFHLAALIGIPYSYIAPQNYVETNISGTLNICMAALESGVERIIHTSTSEVYGTANYVPIDELHPLNPQSPYSASKIGADSVALSFYNSYDLPLSVARPFNTFGPRQSARAIIPTIITQIAAGKRELQLGDLSPTRDFSYVHDTCRGFEAIANSPNTIGEVVNIGSNFEISMQKIFLLIREIMESDVSCKTVGERKRPDKSEVHRLWCDNTKIRSLTQFEPQTTLRDGLVKTIDWFTKPSNLELFKTDIYNV